MESSWAGTGSAVEEGEVDSRQLKVEGKKRILKERINAETQRTAEVHGEFTDERCTLSVHARMNA